MKYLFRVIKFVFIFIVLLLVIDAVLIFSFAHWHPEIKKADAIIVLGAAINSKAATNRAVEALRLYEQGKAPVIVASGGKIADPDISEASYIKKVVRKNSEKEINVITEDQSSNTYENIKNSKAKIPDAKSAIIVSDQFHLARGVLLAIRNGFWPVYWSAPSDSYYGKETLRYYYFREFVAILNYIPKFITN